MTLNDCIYCKQRGYPYEPTKPNDIVELLDAFKRQVVPVDHALLHLMELLQRYK